VLSHRRSFPCALAEVIDACLEPEPGDRPALGEVASACDAVVG
jgi:hypothetical protein